MKVAVAVALVCLPGSPGGPGMMSGEGGGPGAGAGAASRDGWAPVGSTGSAASAGGFGRGGMMGGGPGETMTGPGALLPLRLPRVLNPTILELNLSFSLFGKNLPLPMPCVPLLVKEQIPLRRRLRMQLVAVLV